MYAAKQAGKNCCRFYSSGPAANDPASSQARVSSLDKPAG
jgi:hypothetical protein